MTEKAKLMTPEQIDLIRPIQLERDEGGLIRIHPDKLERLCQQARLANAQAERLERLEKMLKPDCWQPYQADEGSQSYSEPDECLDDYYNDREGLQVGDIVTIEAVCIRNQKWQLKEHANAEEGDGSVWVMLSDEALSPSTTKGEG